MRPVLTAAEMRAADEAAMRTDAHHVLVERAGLAVAIAAARLLGGAYGRRIAVLCGPGSNGADGRVAARRLAARGAAVSVLDAASPPERLGALDLVIDAAFGTGLSRPWDAPLVDDATPVLAVDLPSGVDPDTGVAAGRSLRATWTVAMGALKRGHLLADGAALSGRVEVATLGIPVDRPAVALVEDDDLSELPALDRDQHKWRRAVVVAAGSPAMTGAARLCCEGALSVQAGMVSCWVPGLPSRRDAALPVEVVRVPASVEEAPAALGAVLERSAALVAGPGLGRSEGVRAALAAILLEARVPAVLDADALHLVSPGELLVRQSGGGSPIVLTPHDGEYAAMFGEPAGTDRITAAQRAAASSGCVVLLKGATTVIASPVAPEGVPATLVVSSGAPQLATPGSGDVLCGMIGGLLARGCPALLAAALAAHVHGRAGTSLGARCRAGWLPGAVAEVLQGASPPGGARAR